MSDGHGGDGGVCGGHHDVCAVPVAGPAEAGTYVEAPRPVLPVVNGVEINRAAILDKSKVSGSEPR
ncbi:hypothetical protein GCM10009087_10770 [Sphingomonas oligophenolica]